MITAKQAREIAGPIADEIAISELEPVYDLIKAAATRREHLLKLGGEFWATKGYFNDLAYKTACNKLRDLGYDVSFYYADGQFVDMYTVVKWE